MRSAKAHPASAAILGMGVVYPEPELVGVDFPAEFGSRLVPAFRCAPAPGKGIVPPAKLRRVGRTQELALSAALPAAQGLPDGPRDSAAVFLGTGLGELGSSAAFLRDVLGPEPVAPRPLHFINSVHNSMASETAMALGFRGENTTYTHGAVSFELALERALFVLNRGDAGLALACGVDELTPHAAVLGESCGWCGNGAVPGEGSAAFVLARDGAPALAHVLLSRVRPLPAGGLDALDPRREADYIEESLAGIGFPRDAIGCVILGSNGQDGIDAAHRRVAEEWASRPAHAPAFGAYKHACGEFPTAPALGLALAVEIVRSGSIPARVGLLNGFSKTLNGPGVLLYHLSTRGYRSLCLVAS